MSASEGNKPVTLILVAIAAVIATVLVLEFYGLLRHNPDKEAFPVGEFKAIFLEPGSEFRLSSKAPELHAQCQDGYLVVVSNSNSHMRGILVDYENRGIGCDAGRPSSPAPSQDLTGPEQ